MITGFFISPLSVCVSFFITNTKKKIKRNDREIEKKREKERKRDKSKREK